LKRAGSSVAVVDADLSGRRTMSVLLDSVRQFDANRTLGVYSVVPVGGITAVELTDSLDNAFALRPEEIDSLVDKLVQQNELIVVDAPAPFATALRPFVARASRFVVVLEPNLLGTSAARTLIGDLAKFGVPLNRVWIVTNLRGGRAEIAARELERALGGSVIAEIPTKGDRNYQKAIDTMAKRLASAPAEASLTTLRASTGVMAGGAPAGAPVAAGAHSNGVVASGGDQPMRNNVAPRKSDRRDRLKAEVHEAVGKRIDVVAARSPSCARRSAKPPRNCSPNATISIRSKSARNSSKRSSTKSSASGRSKISCAIRRFRKSWSTARRRSTSNAAAGSR
jgi:hypothetical protein